jgi:C4-type Zn-finger protein
MAMDLRVTNQENSLGSTTASYCLACGAAGKTLFHTACVPSFGGMDISSFHCNECGYHYAKTETRGDESRLISEIGMTTVLTVTGVEDFQRSVILSDEATLILPLLQVEVRSISGGRITTIEGAMIGMRDELSNLNIVASSSNEGDDKNARKVRICSKEYVIKSIKDMRIVFDELLALHEPFEFCIRDPLNRSFISKRNFNRAFGPLRDRGITIESTAAADDPFVSLQPFTRSMDEDTGLGLNEHAGDSERTMQGDQALSSKEFDLGYEYTANPTRMPDTVKVTSATVQECCDFLNEMAAFPEDRLERDDY